MRDAERWRERNRRLHEHFEQVLGKEKGSLVAYHLGDIDDGCVKIAQLIDELAAMDPETLDRNKIARDIQSIVDEFDEHLLPNHVTPLRPLVEPLISELYSRFDDEDEVSEGGHRGTEID